MKILGLELGLQEVTLRVPRSRAVWCSVPLVLSLQSRLPPWPAAHFSAPVQWVGRVAGGQPTLCIMGLAWGSGERGPGANFVLLQDAAPEMSPFWPEQPPAVGLG